MTADGSAHDAALTYAILLQRLARELGSLQGTSHALQSELADALGGKPLTRNGIRAAQSLDLITQSLQDLATVTQAITHDMPNGGPTPERLGDLDQMLTLQSLAGRLLDPDADAAGARDRTDGEIAWL